jgi:hypothetical protein
LSLADSTPHTILFIWQQMRSEFGPEQLGQTPVALPHRSGVALVLSLCRTAPASQTPTFAPPLPSWGIFGAAKGISAALLLYTLSCKLQPTLAVPVAQAVLRPGGRCWQGMGVAARLLVKASEPFLKLVTTSFTFFHRRKFSHKLIVNRPAGDSTCEHDIEVVASFGTRPSYPLNISLG